LGQMLHQKLKYREVYLFDCMAFQAKLRRKVMFLQPNFRL